MLNILDLFSGTGSATAHFRNSGDRVISLEIIPSFGAEITRDIRTVTPDEIARHFKGERIDLVWASPPCQGFSVASIGRYWEMTESGPRPKHDKSREAIAIVDATLHLIRELDPRYWIMESPRGMMRKIPATQRLSRTTITYCQYGDTRQKPTDLFGRFPRKWIPRKPCGPGNACHEAAPRGSKTGTQGIKGHVDRSRVPYELSAEIRAAIVGPDSPGTY